MGEFGDLKVFYKIVRSENEDLFNRISEIVDKRNNCFLSKLSHTKEMFEKSESKIQDNALLYVAYCFKVVYPSLYNSDVRYRSRGRLKFIELFGGFNYQLSVHLNKSKDVVTNLLEKARFFLATDKDFRQNVEKIDNG